MNANEIYQALRNTESRSKRELLDAAADMIKALAQGWSGSRDICDFCVNKKIVCEFGDDCLDCHIYCPCNNCNGSGFEPKEGE